MEFPGCLISFLPKRRQRLEVLRVLQGGPWSVRHAARARGRAVRSEPGSPTEAGRDQEEAKLPDQGSQEVAARARWESGSRDPRASPGVGGGAWAQRSLPQFGGMFEGGKHSSSPSVSAAASTVLSTANASEVLSRLNQKRTGCQGSLNLSVKPKPDARKHELVSNYHLSPILTAQQGSLRGEA